MPWMMRRDRLFGATRRARERHQWSESERHQHYEVPSLSLPLPPPQQQHHFHLCYSIPPVSMELRQHCFPHAEQCWAGGWLLRSTAHSAARQHLHCRTSVAVSLPPPAPRRAHYHRFGISPVASGYVQHAESKPFQRSSLVTGGDQVRNGP